MRKTARVLALAVGMVMSRAGWGAERMTMDWGWKFIQQDVPGAEKSELPTAQAAEWRSLDLPHDWSVEGTFDEKAPAGGGGAYLPTGIGWYRKTFRVPENYRNKTLEIEFDGVYQDSEVWINGHSLGKRPFGYIGLIYDLTPYLNWEGENTLSVRVDNSSQPNSRWYSGSGIYRHTWLRVSDPLSIPQSGTYVTTPEITAEFATVKTAIKVRNGRTTASTFTLRTSILDPLAHSVASSETPSSLAPGQQGEVAQSLKVPTPALWSVETPNLYTLRCEVVVEGKVVDAYDTPFGIRTAVFDVDKGFLLNGTQVKLNGVCLHHDGGGVGAAVPEGVWVRRLTLLREMGCNAIRTSHNPVSPEFLGLCDKMGFLVMDECFDEWEIGKRPKTYHIHFKDWWERDLLDFLHRDRNHPSVVLWSAGNEIGDQTEKRGPEVLKKILEVFHREDPTRAVTAGCDRIAGEPQPTPDEFLSQLDVVGYNYVDRWRDRTNKYYSIDKAAHPTWKFIGTESSTMAAVRGDYKWLLEPPKAGVATQPASKWRRPPQGNLRIDVEQLWKFVRNNDYVAGDFMWTGIDYLGEAAWPNKTALYAPLDTCGFKKDSFYFYQSQWTKTPVLHLFPHWNLQGKEGAIIPVMCYTNCDTVELFLNGKSYGVKGFEFPRDGMRETYGVYPPRTFLPRTTSDLHLSWDVPYEPGTLKAVGMKDGKTFVEEITTTGAPSAVRVTVDRSQLKADARDVVHLAVEILDDAGRVVPTASDDVTFEVTGPAKLISVDNGNPASSESFKANHRQAFNGLCLGILQSTRDAGTVGVTISAKGLKPASVELTTAP